MGLYKAQNLLVLEPGQLHALRRMHQGLRAAARHLLARRADHPAAAREHAHGDYLVATSCRSCRDAYCMIGCPIDSIHRGKHQQIVIEDHCIGCGLCAKNCPYGNISMERDKKHQMTVSDSDHPGQMRQVARLKASVCDLCDAEGHLDEPLPRCVYACPHDAAHRMTGTQLRELVLKS